MPSITIRRLTGVYHADGGVRGEVAYAIGKLRGTAHCALCDITHGAVRRKPEWTRLLAGLAVPFEVVHLNERDDEVALASDGRTPCVLAHTDDRLVVLLGPDELDRAGGDVTRFGATLDRAVAANGLAWPRPGVRPGHHA